MEEKACAACASPVMFPYQNVWVLITPRKKHSSRCRPPWLEKGSLFQELL